jgi:hypothetical protein
MSITTNLVAELRKVTTESSLEQAFVELLGWGFGTDDMQNVSFDGVEGAL